MYLMNIFEQIYLQIIDEWKTIGQQSISNFSKSYDLGLYHFKIGGGHSNQRDFERTITYIIGEPIAYKILDEGCYQILMNHFDKIKTASSKNLIRFNVLVKVNHNYYFMFVIVFNGLHSAELFTSIDISKRKYEYFKTLKSRYDSKGNLNYIITLHDF